MAAELPASPAIETYGVNAAAALDRAELPCRPNLQWSGRYDHQVRTADTGCFPARCGRTRIKIRMAAARTAEATGLLKASPP